MYIVDFLNIGSFIKIIIDRPDDIRILFRNKNVHLESLLRFIINKNGKNIIFHELDYSETKEYIYQKVLNRTDNITNDLVFNDDKLKFNDFKDKFYKRIVYIDLQHRIHRSVSIAIYVEYIFDINIVKKIIVSKTGISAIHNQIIKYYPKVDYYRSFGLTNDKNHISTYSSNNYSYKKYFRAFFSLIKIVLFKPVLSSKRFKTEVLAFVHPKEERFRNLEMDYVLNSFLTAKIINHDVFINGDKKPFKIKTLKLKLVSNYIVYFFNGLKKVIRIASIDLILARNVFNAYIMKYFINNLLNHLNPEVVLCGYESGLSLITGEISKNRNDTISLGYVWSLAYPPIPAKGGAFSKILDRFFIYGQYQKNNIVNCGDSSSAYIITGYVGDIKFNYMKNKAKQLRNELLKSFDFIVAFYDTSFAKDLIVRKKENLDFITKIMNSLKRMNFCLLIKSKKNPDLYSELLNNFNNIYFSWGHGSLIEAFAADVTISYQYNTLAYIANAWDCSVIFKRTFQYQKNEFDLNTYSNNEEIINKLKLMLKDSNGETPINKNQFKQIDYFRDGNAQKRMKTYITTLCHSEFNDKRKKLNHSDSIYKNKYGLDTIKP